MSWDNIFSFCVVLLGNTSKGSKHSLGTVCQSMLQFSEKPLCGVHDLSSCQASGAVWIALDVKADQPVECSSQVSQHGMYEVAGRAPHAREEKIRSLQAHNFLSTTEGHAPAQQREDVSLPILEQLATYIQDLFTALLRGLPGSLVFSCRRLYPWCSARYRPRYEMVVVLARATSPLKTVLPDARAAPPNTHLSLSRATPR